MWKKMLCADGWNVVTEQNRFIARTTDPSGIIGATDERKAELIASGPDMRAALTQLLDRLDYHGSIDPIREEGPIQDARDALAGVREG